MSKHTDIVERIRGAIDATEREYEAADKIELLLAVLKKVLGSRWLSIDFDHNRTAEPCALRAMMIAAIDKAEGRL